MTRERLRELAHITRIARSRAGHVQQPEEAGSVAVEVIRHRFFGQDLTTELGQRVDILVGLALHGDNKAQEAGESVKPRP